MKVKSIITTIFFLALAHISNAHLLNRLTTATSNANTDNVVGMVMDDNYTYVVQNLYPNPSPSPPYTSYSLSGILGVATATTGEYASVVIDRIDNSSGTIVNLAHIDILPSTSYSSVTAKAVALYDGKLYIVGYFSGDVKPNGTLSSKSAQGEDMFICSVLTTNTGVLAWNQSSGYGEERATCIYNDLGVLTVGGYYTNSVSTSYTSTWPTSTVTTAPALLGIGQHNTFIARFSNTTLNCTKASGWMTFSNALSSADIYGIAAATSGGITVNYVTGVLKGTATSPSLYGTGEGVMFTAKYTSSGPPTWGWAVAEGTYFYAPPGHPNVYCSGKAIIFGSSTELYVAGAAAYSGTGPTGYHTGTSDAVLVKYTGITGSSPTTAFVAPMGTSGNDEIANALIYDGTHVCVTGRLSNGNYSFASIGGSTVSYTSSAQSHVFVARYTTAGVLDWNKNGDGTSSDATSNAIACNGKCNLAFGGAIDRQLTWDVYQSNGASSPSTYHIFADFVPVQALSFSATFPTVYNNSDPPFIMTASGATSYIWVWGSIYTMNVSIANGGTPTATIDLVSGGTPSTYFDILVIGSFTHGGASCSNGFETRLYQSTYKKEDDDATSIDDLNQSLNTLNVFPNPFVHQVSINYSFETPANGMIQVVDLTGKIITEVQLSNQSGTEIINTQNWAAGTYIVNLTQGGKQVYYKQIVKD